jgi:hypothetical protein
VFAAYPATYLLVLGAFVLAGAASWLVLSYIPAFYGRYTKTDVGPMLPNRWGWLLMEAPAALVFPLVYFSNAVVTYTVPCLFIAAWSVHYVYRAFIYPFRIQNPQAPMPVLIAALAFVFNCVNGWLMGMWLAMFGSSFTLGWFLDERFITGMLLYFAGMAINRQSDAILFALRKNQIPKKNLSGGKGSYAIPYGGWYRYVSCPNFMGEIVQWLGWALLTWSTAGLAFAFWTICNLLPRALSHHQWYRTHFANYPPERKAVIPFLL